MTNFIYARAFEEGKRDKLIPVDRFNGIDMTDANTVVFCFDNLSSDYDATEGRFTFDITSGSAKEFAEEFCESIVKNAFTVLVDDVEKESVGSDFVIGTVAVASFV
tara:strand:+ start:796 stop:1113 length:318 start_codon:yes stop_codon:yes gene_type:complete